MVTMERIQKDIGVHPCRRCINKQYKVNLEPKDCQYYLYPVMCSKCREDHNIVTGFNLSGKLKLLLK